MITYKSLYEYDNSGRLRVWWMERAGDSYRTISGLENGVKTESAWKKAKPKNIGRANSTTGEQQAEAEINSLYTKRIKMGAAYSLEELAAKPKMFDPMLAVKYEDVKNKLTFPLWTQPKLDGYRCVVKSDGMWSRGREKIVSCPHIFEELEFIFKSLPNVVFDGELYNHQFKDNFNKLSSLIGKDVNITPITLAETAELVEYHIYDFCMDDSSLFRERYHALKLFFADHSFKKIKLVETNQIKNDDELNSYLNIYLADGYEGQIIRSDTHPYETGKRSKSLIKNKNFHDEEFIVIDLIEGRGNWSGKAKSALLQLPNGNTCEAGIRGNEAYLTMVLREKHKYIGKPAKVRYQNWTPDGKLRIAIVLELNRSM